LVRAHPQMTEREEGGWERGNGKARWVEQLREIAIKACIEDREGDLWEEMSLLSVKTKGGREKLFRKKGGERREGCEKALTPSTIMKIRVNQKSLNTT